MKILTKNEYKLVVGGSNCSCNMVPVMESNIKSINACAFVCCDIKFAKFWSYFRQIVDHDKDESAIGGNIYGGLCADNSKIYKHAFVLVDNSFGMW